MDRLDYCELEQCIGKVVEYRDVLFRVMRGVDKFGSICLIGLDGCRPIMVEPPPDDSRKDTKWPE